MTQGQGSFAQPAHGRAKFASQLAQKIGGFVRVSWQKRLTETDCRGTLLQHLMKRSSAFTLIELLVVISIIGILASLAIPAVAGALVKGQMTGTMNNARQLQLATFNVNLENEAAGQLGAWPATSNGPTTFALWRDLLTNVLTASDLAKLFSAPGVAVSNALSANAAQIAFNVYKVGDTEESGAIFISTRNWSAASPTTPPTDAAKPYGNKGVVILRKGGDALILQSRFLTNTNTLGLPGGTNPALLQ